MYKKCILYDRKCIECNECNICDLDSKKICDNCEKCIETHHDYLKIKIDEVDINQP